MLADADTSPSTEAATAASAAGILRRGRFAAMSPNASSSSNVPPSFLVTPLQLQRRYRILVVITVIGVISFGITACFLLGGRILPGLTAPAPPAPPAPPVFLPKKLRGAPPPERGGFDQMAVWLRAETETAGMPPEERKRVSLCF